MPIPEENILRVMNLLTAWNPIGDKADSIKDLDSYRTEAIDILFNLDSDIQKASAARIVRDVLNQAFDLSLSLEECMDIGRQILEQVSDT
ncbi:DUF1871 family protein [Thermodesulfobacteriota bacterium]